MSTLKIRRMIDRNDAVRVSVILPVLVLTMASVSRADDVVTHWNKVMLATIAAGGTDPITSTRTATIVQAAVFDSVNGIQRKYTPIHADFPKPDGASVSAAVIESAYATQVALYPDQRRILKAERRSSLGKLQASHDAIRQGREFGALVRSGYPDLAQHRRIRGGASSLSWAEQTAGNGALRLPISGPEPLPQVATAIPWSIRSPNQFRPAGPPSLTSDEYTAAFNEVKMMGSADNSPRTPDQTLLAIFWAGNTPAYWNRIASSVINDHPRLALIHKARVFALLNIAMADAIACWDAKYYYQFWRPITAITMADLDGNPDTDVAPSWTPLLGGTPAPPRICFRALHHKCLSRLGARSFFRP